MLRVRVANTSILLELPPCLHCALVGALAVIGAGALLQLGLLFLLLAPLVGSGLFTVTFLQDDQNLDTNIGKQLLKN